MSRLFTQVFVALLIFSRYYCSIVNTPDHVECTSLNNEQYMTQTILISLHAIECIERLRYCPFTVNLQLMIYPIRYAFHSKQKIYFRSF